MQHITNKLSDAFSNLKKVTKSHIPTINALVWIDVPIEQFVDKIANESRICQNHGRLIDLKDKSPHKRKEENIQDESIKEIGTFKEFRDITNK